MSPIYLIADSIASPLGLGTAWHWQRLEKGDSAISLVSREDIVLKDFHAASISPLLWEEWRSAFSLSLDLSRLETLMLTTLRDAALQCPVDFSSSKTLLVFSTTKGNIDTLSSQSASQGTLMSLASRVASELGNPNVPLVVSNACISGLSALLIAQSLLRSGKYEHAVVCGGDLLSEFTVSGFQCLHAISPFPCTPFDQGRMGLSPGEACGTLVLSRTRPTSTDTVITLAGGASSNDANHISGPSRTGDGLALAISKALKIAKLSAKDISYTCTHGTATLYNDESESKALALAGINMAPANSLKGYFGHTYGAAGVIETILTAQSMKKSQILGSLGYKQHGVSTVMDISANTRKHAIAHSLKTASGFGSCNAALILSAA